MAFGLEIYNLLPNEAYMLVHVIALILGALLAKKAFSMSKQAWGWLFAFYAISELVHLLAHFGIVVLPFSHLVQEVLLLVGFIMVYMEMNKS